MFYLLFAIHFIADAKLFKKVGVEGWKAYIPVCREYQWFKLVFGDATRPTAAMVTLFIVAAVSPVSWLGFGGLLVLHALTSVKKAQAYGRDLSFAVGLFFLPGVFSWLLVLQNAEYRGVAKALLMQ